MLGRSAGATGPRGTLSPPRQRRSLGFGDGWLPQARRLAVWGGGVMFLPLMASQNVLVFNDLNFDQEVLKSDQPVLVDFTATWCGPCRALSPIIDQVAEELVGKVKVGKVDIDEAPLTAGKFGVRGVPTIMIFKNGERLAQHVGLATKQKVLDLVGS